MQQEWKNVGQEYFKIVIDKPTGNRPSGRSRRKWNEYVRMYLNEIGVNTRIWVYSVQNRDYWTNIMNATWNLRIR